MCPAILSMNMSPDDLASASVGLYISPMVKINCFTSLVFTVDGTSEAGKPTKLYLKAIW